MEVSDTPSALKQVRRTAWKFQRTFRTPVKNLQGVCSAAPKTFVIYADHDEYTTFYANSRSNLNRVTESLLTQGFEEVSGYQRRL